MGGSKLKINWKIYNITPGIQKVLTDTTKIPIKKLNEQDREKFIFILESFDLRILNQYVVNQNQVDINNLKAILKNVTLKVKD